MRIGYWALLGFFAGTSSCKFGTRPAPSVESRVSAISESSRLLELRPTSKDAGAVTDAGISDGAIATGIDAAAPAPRFGGPWPMGRGDFFRRGRSPYRLPERAPKEVWRYKTHGAVVAPPTLAADGSILFTSHDHFLYAVDSNGELRWKHRTQDMVWSAAALSQDGLAFVGSDDDHLYALRVEDGTQVFALSPGSCRWSVGRGPEAMRCDIEDVTLGPDGTVYAGGDGIYAIQPTGRVRWHFEPDANKKRHCSSAPALASDGGIYAVCGDVLYALLPDGNKRWQFEGPGEFDSAPAISAEGIIYVGDEARRLIALDAQGQVRFSYTAGGAVRAAPALRRDGGVVFGAYDGVLYVLRADGTLAWTFTSADSIHSAPLVDADDAVVFGSRDNRLYALSADGQLRWALTLDDDVDGTPALGPDGTIYVGSDDQALHAFR